MRSLIASAVLTLGLALPAAAYATTFTYTPDDGSAVKTFSLSGTPNYSQPDPESYATYQPVLDTTSGLNLNVFFFGAEYATSPLVQAQSDYAISIGREGHGAISFELDLLAAVSAFVDGPQLYSGLPSSPNFINGTYHLTGDTYYATATEDGPYSTTGGTLVISGGSGTSPSSVTPEPSSLVLLGTGVLSLAGTARRKLRKA